MAISADANVRDWTRTAEAKAESKHRRFVAKRKRMTSELDIERILSDLKREKEWTR